MLQAATAAASLAIPTLLAAAAGEARLVQPVLVRTGERLRILLVEVRVAAVAQTAVHRLQVPTVSRRRAVMAARAMGAPVAAQAALRLAVTAQQVAAARAQMGLPLAGLT